MDQEKNIIGDHESPVRRIMSDANNTPYKAIDTLEEARNVKNSYAIMEGDDGGQIYLVCPVDIIKCNEDALKKLLKELDKKAWNDESATGLFFEVHEPGSGISGGMSGGMAESDLWVHKNFDSLKSDIIKLLQGEVDSID